MDAIVKKNKMDKQDKKKGKKRQRFEIFVTVIYCLTAIIVGLLCLRLIPLVNKTDYLVGNVNHHLRGVKWTELLGDIRDIQTLTREARERLEQVNGELKRAASSKAPGAVNEETAKEPREGNETNGGWRVIKVTDHEDLVTSRSSGPERREEPTSSDESKPEGSKGEDSHEPDSESDHEHEHEHEHEHDHHDLDPSGTTERPTAAEPPAESLGSLLAKSSGNSAKASTGIPDLM